MMHKRLLCPERLRRVPPQFSWLDHRLVRDNRLARSTPQALALYLVLVTVADSQGLSYYAEASLARLIGLTPDQVIEARQQLLQSDLIAYQKPVYQVLSLEAADARHEQTRSAGQLLRHILGAAQ